MADAPQTAATLTPDQIRAKLQELRSKRAKRAITNLIIIIVIMTVVGGGLTTIGMQQVFIFIAIGLMPGLAASITDVRPGKFGSKTVIAFNLAGMMQFLAAILMGGSPNQTANEVIYDPRTWMLVYGFAAFGWAVIFVIPHIVQLYLEITATYTVKKLKSFQEALAGEWGDGVKQ